MEFLTIFHSSRAYKSLEMSFKWRTGLDHEWTAKERKGRPSFTLRFGKADIWQ